MGTKKVRLPPTTLEGIAPYYSRRGFRRNPIMAWSEGADRNYVKPLPDGRRMHVRVYQFPRHFKIRTHIDHYDPGKDAIGHVLVDGPVKRRNQTVKISRRKSSDSIFDRIGKFLED